MSVVHSKRRQGRHHRSNSGVYTVCFAALLIPLVVLLGVTLLQAAMSNYEQSRIRFVGNEVIEQFESLNELDEKKFTDLFIALAAANGLKINKQVKITIRERGSDRPEPYTEINVQGNFSSMANITFAEGFNQSFILKDSQFSTHGYLAINGYPYCEFNPNQNLSTYLPLYRPSPTAPTWHFQQDAAIGGVRKAMGINQEGDELNPQNWKQLAENLTSFY